LRGIIRSITTSGLRLKEWRARRRLSLRDLGARAGISYVSIARIEAGSINPTLATLQSLADALGITTRDLFPRRTQTPSTRKETTPKRPRPKTT
jgi:transcriptional regulator with XRE-family HTH domain